MRNSTKQTRSTPTERNFNRKENTASQSNAQRNPNETPVSRQPRDENGKFGNRNK